MAPPGVDLDFDAEVDINMGTAEGEGEVDLNMGADRVIFNVSGVGLVGSALGGSARPDRPIPRILNSPRDRPTRSTGLQPRA
jgi:hypothetical protein